MSECDRCATQQSMWMSADAKCDSCLRAMADAELTTLRAENEALKKENEWCEKRLGDILQEKIDDLTARNERLEKIKAAAYLVARSHNDYEYKNGSENAMRRLDNLLAEFAGNTDEAEALKNPKEK